MINTLTSLDLGYPHYYRDKLYIENYLKDNNRPKYKARFIEGEWTPVAVAGESTDGRIITREFLEKIAENYAPEKNGIKAKIKIGHKNPYLPEGKSYGYFSEIRMSKSNPDILEAKPEWVHEELINKLESGEYRDISPEFRPIVTNTGKNDEQGNILYDINYYFAGVAVLGESHPAFPSLSIDFDSGRINDLSYKSSFISIDQQKNNKYNYSENYLELKQKYENLIKENENLKMYYTNQIDELQNKLNSYKDNSKLDHIIAFCEENLRNGKLKPVELMKTNPYSPLKESGLVKHLLSLSARQLEFEEKLISGRESIKDNKHNFKAYTNNHYTEINDEELEEKLFMDFCNEHNFDLNYIDDIDRAYKEWNKYVRY